jgi:serine acetyltransferase
MADSVGTAVGRRVKVGRLDAVGTIVGTGPLVVGRRVTVGSAVVVGADVGRNEVVVDGGSGKTSTVEGAGEFSKDMEKEESPRKKAQSSSMRL